MLYFDNLAIFRFLRNKKNENKTILNIVYFYTKKIKKL